MASAHPGAAAASRAAWRRALERSAGIDAEGTIFPVLVEQLGARFGPAPALLSESDSLSYRDLAQRAAGYAQWALRRGIGAGTVACLLMPNCADYLACWLGVTRVGGIVALVNPQLRGATLAHAIGIAAPAHLIVAAELAGRIAELQPALDPAVRVWAHGGDGDGIGAIDPDPRAATPLPPPPALGDTALYIYTSGTTGLPKAARITHRRIMQWSLWFAGMMDTQPEDRLYDCLPMCHSVGGVAAIGAVLAGGGSVVLRRGFSASRFWDDVAGLECTLFQYIGELCRYLLAAPPHPRERQHRLRLACGNGLRADVWQRFVARFAIPQVLEFYAATEGSFALVNAEGRVGAIGRVPRFLRHRVTVELIAVDAETGAPQREANGFCRRCAAGEAGEAIGRIGAGSRFDGYTDREASAAKVLRDVFAPGDAWYRTGDLMRRDAEGFYYFVDRLGDTFRWKGENVATREVEQAIAACPGVRDCIVYGVTVPGRDGRAGMAAIVAEPGFDPAELRRHLERELPDYARPLFLRVVAALATTGTHKPVKGDLLRDGYDPGATADSLYVDDRERAAFVALDGALYRRIRDGRMRL